MINNKHELVCHLNETNSAVDVNHENTTNITKTPTIHSHEDVDIDNAVKKMVSHVHCPRCEPRLTALGVSVQGWRSTQEDAEIGFMLPLPLLRLEHSDDHDKIINVSESLQHKQQEEEHQLCEQSTNNTTENLHNTNLCHEGKNYNKKDDNITKEVVDYNNDKTVISIENNYTSSNSKEEVESWCSLPAAVFAVFDGHGGDAIAKLSAAYFETYLMNAINHCVAKIDENKKKKMKKVDTTKNNNGVSDVITNTETTTSVNSTTDMNDQNAKKAELGNKLEQGIDDKMSKYYKDNEKNVIDEKREIEIKEENNSYSTEKDELVELYEQALHILYKVHYSRKRFSQHAYDIETPSNKLQKNNDDNSITDRSNVHIAQTNTLTDEKKPITTETVKATTSSSLHELQHESPSEKQLANNINCTHSIEANTTALSESLETHKSSHLIDTHLKHDDDDVDGTQETKKVIGLESTTLPYTEINNAYTNTLIAVATTDDRSLHAESCTCCCCQKEQEHENNVIESRIKDKNINTKNIDGINTIERTKVSLTYAGETITSVALTDNELHILHQFFTELFTDALLSLDDYLYKTPEGYRGDYNCVGATACIVLITSQLIICANVGDSGAALYSFHTNDFSTECNELHNTNLIRKAAISHQSNDQNINKEVLKEQEYKLQQDNPCKQELSEKYEEMKKENQCCCSCCSQPEKSAPEKTEKTCMCGCTIERLTTPHRITDTEEQERVKAAGYALFSNKDKYTDSSHGCVNNDENNDENSENEINDLRIEGVLSVPRALGDYDFKQCGNKNAKQQAVIAVPTITIRPVPHALLQSLPCNCHCSTNVGVSTVNDVNLNKNINSNITQQTYIKQTNVGGENNKHKSASNSEEYESIEEKHNNNISHSHVNVEQSSLCTAKCK